MKALKVTGVLALLTATSLAFGGDQACPAPQAARAEATLANLHSWSDAIKFFKRYKACLDGGTSEGFTTFLAEQLAADRGVERLWAQTRGQIWFRSVVSKRMESEVISLETTELLLKNLRAHCPVDAKGYCQDLAKRIRPTCSACAPGS